MTLCRLEDLLDRVEADRELWRAGDDESYTARDVALRIGELRAALGPLRGASIALACQSPLLLSTLLVALDGWAGELLLLPGHLPPPDQQSLMAQRPIDALFTDDPQMGECGGGRIVMFEQQPGGGWQPTYRALVNGVQVPTQGPTRWVLCTSGTTGTPKQVSHTLESLTRTTKQDVARGREFRWGSLYNLTGFAGLQVFFQSWCAGSTLLLQPNGATLEERVAGLLRGGCNALSATPTMWRKLLMTCHIEQLPLRRITLGGEIVDQGILTTLARTFPQARIVHIYASTEAGVGFAVRDGRAGFPRSYLEGAAGGIRLKVTDDGHLWLQRESDSASMDGRQNDRWIDSGDQVDIRGDRVYFLGRADGTINVGGNKVHPEEVECCLLAHPAVCEARVTPRRSPFTGWLVQAEVVCGPHLDRNQVAPREFIAWCRERLPAYKVPAAVRIVDELRAADSGKLRRTA